MRIHRIAIAVALFALFGGLLITCGNRLSRHQRREEVGGRNPLTGALSQKAFVAGVVKDESGPVTGAIVRIKGTTFSSITDVEGKFSITGFDAEKQVVVTAWARGYYVGGGEPCGPGVSNLVITLKKHSGEDNRAYEWLPPRRVSGESANQGCAECHSREGANLPFLLPVDEWMNDAHSKSAVNQRFLTMYEGSDVLGRRSDDTRYFDDRDYGRFPLLPDRARPYYGPGYRLDYPDFDGNCAACHTPAASVNAPYSTDPRNLSGTFAEGISCDFCHKIWDVKIDPATRMPHANAPGVLSFEFRRPHKGHQFFAGPYDDVAPGEDTYSPAQRESRFCSACHYGVFWDTVVYNSYGEWLESPYAQTAKGKTCQDCHMPPGGARFFARPDKGGISRDPQVIFSHRMPGAAEPELLRNAVTMHLTARRAVGKVMARVNIVNDKAGHHVPTDSPLRQMILLVKVTNHDGNACRLLDGPTLPSWCGSRSGASGHYAGLPGRAYAKVLEELWTRISPSGAYWNPTRIVSDSRLAAFASDTSTFTFACRDEGDVTIEARLLFRRAYIDLMEIKGWKFPDITMEEETVRIR